MKSRYALATLTLICTLLGGTGRAASKVEFKPEKNKIDVFIGGKLFTSYLYAEDPSQPMVRKDCVLAKPVLFPVHTPSGEMICRGYPFISIEGENQDHPHHMGIYFTIDINKHHFWGNSTQPLPKIRHLRVFQMKGDAGQGTLTTESHWLGNDGNPMLLEQREMIFRSYESKDQYAIDFNITLKALHQDVVFSDTKEGMMAIRVAPWLKETGGTGKYLSSEGKETEKNVWGRRAQWMRLEGKKDNKIYGVAILNHPDSVNYPTFWHARGYGCFTANPLGQGAFEKAHKVPNAKDLNFTLRPGQGAIFKHRMLIYEGLRSKEQLEKEFQEYTK
ncbi:MAG: PmoA family protein [Sedimentisphaerales bacterium]|nr:PmoA family protein [Sedimentisphaerales bacterium]